MASDGYQGRRQVVQDVEWTSFAKGFAAAQTLHPVMGVSTKPACWKHFETNYLTTNSLQQMHVAPVTNFKHCGLQKCVWLAMALAAFFYIQDGFNGNARACNVYSCWCPDLYTSVSHCYRFCTLIAIAGYFGEVQPGFLQLLTQTWVKCTSLDSSRCVFTLIYDLRQFELQVKD